MAGATLNVTAPLAANADKRTSKIGGADAEISDAPSDAKALMPLHEKEDRKSASDDKRNELFDRATKTAHAKCETVLLNLSDKAKLDNACNLSTLIGKTKDHLIVRDSRNALTILCPDPNDDSVTLSEQDLFKDHDAISLEDVAASSLWCCKWPKDPTCEQNLTLTAKFLQNKVADKSWEKRHERCAKHEPVELGGPHQLVSNTEDAGRASLSRLESLSIRRSRRKCQEGG